MRYRSVNRSIIRATTAAPEASLADYHELWTVAGAMADDEAKRAAAIREYQKTIVQHKEIETTSKKRAC